MKKKYNHPNVNNLQAILDFLDTAENKFAKLGPLGTDIDAVKRQIAQLKQFKLEVDPHMVKVEALNRYESSTITLVFSLSLFE